MSTTPNLGLQLPSTGSTNWSSAANGNFAILDSAIPKFADAEIPQSSGDGVTFALAHTPNPISSLILVYNGLVQRNGQDYTLSANKAIFINDLGPTPDVIAWYRYTNN